jgi:hypothetical protein
MVDFFVTGEVRWIGYAGLQDYGWIFMKLMALLLYPQTLFKCLIGITYFFWEYFFKAIAEVSNNMTVSS